MPIYERASGLWVPQAPKVMESGAPTIIQRCKVYTGGVWVLVYENEVVVVAPTSATIANVEDLFDAVEAGLWAGTKNKRLIVDSSRGPLVVDSEPGGVFIFEVTGTGIISGIGGALNSGIGGNALDVTVATGFDLINEGIIRGGGGGGGLGGEGGDGEINTLVREPAGTATNYNAGFPIYSFDNGRNFSTNALETYVYWNGDSGGGGVQLTITGQGWLTQYTHAGYTYYRSTYVTGNGNALTPNRYRIYRTSGSITPTDGGAGGAGGRGEGADGAAASGTAGSAGGTNAGAGGTGGDGGAYGDAGDTGNTGAAGNVGSGAAGVAGGASGKSINGYNRVSYTGGGSLVGPTANN